MSREQQDAPEKQDDDKPSTAPETPAPAADTASSTTDLERRMAELDLDEFRRKNQELHDRVNATLARCDEVFAGTRRLDDRLRQFDDTMNNINRKMVGALAGAMGSMMGSAGMPDPVMDAVLAQAPQSRWHGIQGDAGWAEPRCVARSSEEARPGTAAGIDASEFQDEPHVLEQKVDMLVRILREASHAICYSGAGISTAAGIKTFARLPAGSISGVTDAARAQKLTRAVVEAAEPTLTHRVLAALMNHSDQIIKEHISCNHDSLELRAGAPPDRVCFPHGRIGDAANPVVKMSQSLRPDLGQWALSHIGPNSDFVLVLGASLCSVRMDSIASLAARSFANYQAVQFDLPEAQIFRHSAAADAAAGDDDAAADSSSTLPQLHHGCCIVNLQKTPLDAQSTLRIWAPVDVVTRMVAEKLQLRVDAHQRALPFDVVTSDPAFCYRWTGPDGRDIPDDRQDMEKSRRLAAIVDRLTPLQRDDILHKLTKLCQGKKKVLDVSPAAGGGAAAYSLDSPPRAAAASSGAAASTPATRPAVVQAAADSADAEVAADDKQ